MSARDIPMNKKPGEKYTTLESILLAWYVKHPADADEAYSEFARLQKIEQAAREYVYHGKPDSYRKLAAALEGKT